MPQPRDYRIRYHLVEIIWFSQFRERGSIAVCTKECTVLFVCARLGSSIPAPFLANSVPYMVKSRLCSTRTSGHSI